MIDLLAKFLGPQGMQQFMQFAASQQPQGLLSPGGETPVSMYAEPSGVSPRQNYEGVQQSSTPQQGDPSLYTEDSGRSPPSVSYDRMRGREFIDKDTTPKRGR